MPLPRLWFHKCDNIYHLLEYLHDNSRISSQKHLSRSHSVFHTRHSNYPYNEQDLYNTYNGPPDCFRFASS